MQTSRVRYLKTSYAIIGSFGLQCFSLFTHLDLFFLGDFLNSLVISAISRTSIFIYFSSVIDFNCIIVLLNKLTIYITNRCLIASIQFLIILWLLFNLLRLLSKRVGCSPRKYLLKQRLRCQTRIRCWSGSNNCIRCLLLNLLFLSHL